MPPKIHTGPTLQMCKKSPETEGFHDSKPCPVTLSVISPLHRSRHGHDVVLALLRAMWNLLPTKRLLVDKYMLGVRTYTSLTLHFLCPHSATYWQMSIKNPQAIQQLQECTKEKEISDKSKFFFEEREEIGVKVCLGKASLMKASHQPHSNVAHACKLHILVSI